MVTPNKPVNVGSSINTTKDGFTITLKYAENEDIEVSWFLVEERK